MSHLTRAVRRTQRGEYADYQACMVGGTKHAWWVLIGTDVVLNLGPTSGRERRERQVRARSLPAADRRAEAGAAGGPRVRTRTLLRHYSDITPCCNCDVTARPMSVTVM